MNVDFSFSTQTQIQHNVSSKIKTSINNPDVDPYFLLKFGLQSITSTTEKEFQAVCKGIQVVLTSFVRPIRDICKLLTFNYSVVDGWAIVKVTVNKREHLDELKSFIKEVIANMKTFTINIEIESEINYSQMLESQVITLPGQHRIRAQGHLGQDVIPTIESLIGLLRFKKPKSLLKGKIKYYLQLLNKFKCHIVQGIQQKQIQAKALKLPFKMAILSKAYAFAEKYMKSEINLEFACSGWLSQWEIEYRQPFVGILKAFIKE